MLLTAGQVALLEPGYDTTPATLTTTTTQTATLTTTLADRNPANFTIRTTSGGHSGTATLVVTQGDARTFAGTWYVDNEVYDLSDFTFTLKVFLPGATTTTLTKTAGFTGATTAPNITIAFTTSDLALAPAYYRCQLIATRAGLPRSEWLVLKVLESAP